MVVKLNSISPKTKILIPLPQPEKEFEEIEKKIISLFKKALYEPLLGEASLPVSNKSVLRNQGSKPGPKSALFDALSGGRVTYSKGIFSGKFSADISKELKLFGAKWDASNRVWKLPLSEMPIELKNQIGLTSFRFQEKLEKLDKFLSQIVPEELASKLKISKIFDTAIFKSDDSQKKTLRSITVSPKFSAETRKKIADEWQTNMDLWIRDFTEKEIIRLRKEVQKSALAGNRYEELANVIKKSFGVTERKAKFLARQETKLLTTKLQNIRYVESGVYKYKWRSVHGTSAHPVRPMHKALNDRSDKGELFDFRNPPVTNPEGQHNNPGQDYNCRCVAIPVVTA